MYYLKDVKKNKTTQMMALVFHLLKSFANDKVESRKPSGEFRG